MCGIFGAFGEKPADLGKLKVLSRHSLHRGKDSSGLLYSGPGGTYRVIRADKRITKLFEEIDGKDLSVLVGHSRLITNGMVDNQPVVSGRVAVFHNGVVVNHEDLWGRIRAKRSLEIDTEVIAAISHEHLSDFGRLCGASEKVLDVCRGAISAVVVSPETGELILFSNTGSLYIGEVDGVNYFASESWPLTRIGVPDPVQVIGELHAKVPEQTSLQVEDIQINRPSLVHSFNYSKRESEALKFTKPSFVRCTKCVLPETMPFISFDSSGVCNYCHAYRPRNSPKPVDKLLELLEPYRRLNGPEAILPFSGGRDSSFALHLVARELGIKSIAFTYDWGMVTDLGRRNISRMCSALGVENIVVAADISKKRKHINANLTAWLKRPHLGMISLLTAGDKHFFRYVESVKRQTGVSLNLWGVNPLETTHFKAGYLGVPPDFQMQGVYSSGLMKQFSYHRLRLGEMMRNPRYFNSSIWDTLTGEYFRSIAKKSDYFHVFDYWKWDEKEIDHTLRNLYDWEVSGDTSTTWRIGDGTAGFYNYVYYTVGGFSEHDTFRSNQIREGDITRETALNLIDSENLPRYENIKWYLDSIGLDFQETIAIVNAIPKLYAE